MSSLAVHFEAVVVTVLALLSAVVILQQRRTPQSTAAWLLFIIVLPYVAIPLFLALGFRKRGAGFRPIAFDRRGVEPVPDPPRIAAVLEGYGIPAASDGNDLRLLARGEDAFGALIGLCRAATTRLDCLFYIVADDAVGRAFVDELAQRARAGVKVRLLIDRLGNLRPPHAALAALTSAGGEVRYGVPLLRGAARGHLNLRNHRKMVIADGGRVFAGGMNVGADYMGPAPDAARWTDLAFLLEGPAAATYGDIFRADWSAAGGATVPEATVPRALTGGTTRAQLVPSGPDMAGDPLHDALVNAIHGAERRVWLVTPYFLPTEFLGNALAIAARRGVDVRILLPHRSNQRLADFARGAYLRDMQEAGCRIVLFQPGMIHAKVGLLDDVGYLGSANFDIRSMLLNFETALFVYDAGSVGALADWFALQERQCSAGLPDAGRLRRISEGVFRLGAPVL